MLVIVRDYSQTVVCWIEVMGRKCAEEVVKDNKSDRGDLRKARFANAKLTT